LKLLGGIWQVLEEEEYLRRKVFYQEIGQRHYYFMNVGNGEVIDACRKVCFQRPPAVRWRGLALTLSGGYVAAAAAN